MQLSASELLILGRLTNDTDLLALLEQIDKDKELLYLEQMRAESQSPTIDPNTLIQLGAKASERKNGCRLYVELVRTAIRRSQSE